MVAQIESFSEKYPHNRYLVTCRIYAYADPGYRLTRFRHTILAPFDPEQISGFIDAWYKELAFQKRLSQSKADEMARGLKTAIHRSDIGALAERPLLMTVMALLHTSYGQLPDDRVELYQWAVDLLFRRWKGHIGKGEQGLREALEMPHLKMDDLLAGLYCVAHLAHSGQRDALGTADIAEEVLLKHLKPYLGNDWNRAERFVQYVRERAGLLIRHKTDAYTFPHRTFQEFMAACHLTGLKDYPHEAAHLVREDPDRWRIVFILAAGHARRSQLGNAISAVGKLCL
jgi:predicted NACHT family NTPase